LKHLLLKRILIKTGPHLEDFDIYLIANGATQDTQTCALILHLGRKDVKEIFKTQTEKKMLLWKIASNMEEPRR